MSAVVPDLAALEPILTAIDRLNPHARAWGNGKEAIYAYKTLAAVHCATLGLVKARPIKVTTKCNRCGGTGRYVHDYAWSTLHERNVPISSPCRGCSAMGKTELRFVETEIGERRWHHPYSGPNSESGRSILYAAWRIRSQVWPDDVEYSIALCEDGSERPIILEDPGDWAPLRPSQKLPCNEAAELLNQVEDWVLQLRSSGHACWPHERARQRMAHYDLDLGQDSEGPCCKCGSSDDLERFWLGAMRYRLHWSEPICRPCHDQNPFVWPQHAPPERLLSPAIRTWLDRRGIRIEDGVVHQRQGFGEINT